MGVVGCQTYQRNAKDNVIPLSLPLAIDENACARYGHAHRLGSERATRSR